ncbi:hypothetical protein GQ53DRAFT_341289 [Thozetella sp. PMI_491]|nr:hypothetical protein GQ53DRAFT_341289 [Thozetella sp. PMI_491]
MLLLAVSLPSNVVYILVFILLELCLGFSVAACFAFASAQESNGTSLKEAAGTFCFASGLLGYYSLAHFYCRRRLPSFPLPMGDTSLFFDKIQGLNAY